MSLATTHSANIPARHDLDTLTATDRIEVSPAIIGELADIIALGAREIPQLAALGEPVRRVHERDPESILAFRRGGRPIGACAFLHLNIFGLERLLLGQFPFAEPEIPLLARRDEPPAGIYVWAICGRGNAAAGFRNASELLRAERFARANMYARPTTPDGARFLAVLGFHPTPAAQTDLWRYERITNRLSS